VSVQVQTRRTYPRSEEQEEDRLPKFALWYLRVGLWRDWSGRGENGQRSLPAKTGWHQDAAQQFLATSLMVRQPRRSTYKRLGGREGRVEVDAGAELWLSRYRVLGVRDRGRPIKQTSGSLSRSSRGPVRGERGVTNDK
jgi:hypothetical protein